MKLDFTATLRIFAECLGKYHKKYLFESKSCAVFLRTYVL